MTQHDIRGEVLSVLTAITPEIEADENRHPQETAGRHS